jgi:hypothetical protein
MSLLAGVNALPTGTGSRTIMLDRVNLVGCNYDVAIIDQLCGANYSRMLTISDIYSINANAKVIDILDTDA